MTRIKKKPTTKDTKVTKVKTDQGRVTKVKIY